MEFVGVCVNYFTGCDVVGFQSCSQRQTSHLMQLVLLILMSSSPLNWYIKGSLISYFNTGNNLRPPMGLSVDETTCSHSYARFNNTIVEPLTEWSRSTFLKYNVSCAYGSTIKQKKKNENSAQTRCMLTVHSLIYSNSILVKPIVFLDCNYYSCLLIFFKFLFS